MNEPSSVLEILKHLLSINVINEFTIEQGDLVTPDQFLIVKTSPPLSKQNKYEIEMGACWYGGPTKVIFKGE